MTVLLERGLQEVNQIKAKVEEESALIWVKFEAKVQGESAPILDQILETKLEEVYEIEAKLQREAWTVVAKMDTIMLRTWLNEASKFQEEMNKTIAYRKSGRLDWETNKFKIEAVVTKNGAIAPQPVQLTTDARFSAPMLSMGRRRVTGVKMLREISRGAPKANRPRIENIIKLYEKNEITNIKTAENIVERLANRTAQKRLTDKTDNIYSKLTMKAEGARLLL